MTSTCAASGWFKSSYSDGGSNNCVEAQLDTDAVLVRDSKAPTSGNVRYPRQPWDAFLSVVRTFS